MSRRGVEQEKEVIFVNRVLVVNRACALREIERWIISNSTNERCPSILTKTSKAHRSLIYVLASRKPLACCEMLSISQTRLGKLGSSLPRPDILGTDQEPS